MSHGTRMSETLYRHEPQSLLRSRACLRSQTHVRLSLTHVRTSNGTQINASWHMSD